MLGWLRNIFRKKGKEEAVSGPAPQQASRQAPENAEVPEREIEDTPQQRMEKMTAREKELAMDPDRPEKKCPKCGAPNDEFVDVCWMCKEHI